MSEPSAQQRADAFAREGYRGTGMPVPIEFDNPRAKYTATLIEHLLAEVNKIPEHDGDQRDPVELGCALAQANATLALAQEVSTLRQMLDLRLERRKGD